MGKVIGKQGRIAKAIRTVIKAATNKVAQKVYCRDHMTEYFELGRILKPQGIKGEVKLDALLTAYPVSLILSLFISKKTEYERVDIENARIDARYAYLKLQGIDTRDDAEKLRGTLLYIDRAHAAQASGRSVLYPGSNRLHRKGRYGQGARYSGISCRTVPADVYVVKLEREPVSFPAVEHIVLVRDIENGVITVDAQRLAEVAVYDI